MTGSVEIYYTLASPFCRSLLMLAKALNLNLDLKALDLSKGEHMTSKYLRLNPEHSVPTMVEEGFVLWESRAIMKYLVDRYAKDQLYYPEDIKDAAVVNQRLYFDATVLAPRLMEYYFPVIGLDQQPDIAKKIKYEEALGILDGFLEKGMWVAGHQMTIADFSIIANVSTAEAVGVDLTNYPNLYDWYERTKAAMADYGYDEINQEGANILGKLFKSKQK